MPACQNTKYTGRDVVLEYVIGCGDTIPSESEWKRLASMRTKDFTVDWDSADATADDSIGALRENLPTFQSLTMSGDGTAKASDPNQVEFAKHAIKPDATGGKPYVWLRQTFPDLTFIAFTMISSYSRSAPYDDVVTFSIETQATASDHGLIVEDTPDPSAPAVTGVAAFPDTINLAVGGTAQAAAIVSPVGSSQAVNWSSATPATATVSASGLVTGVAAGTVLITATSVSDPTKTDTISVTVA